MNWAVSVDSRQLNSFERRIPTKREKMKAGIAKERRKQKVARAVLSRMTDGIVKWHSGKQRCDLAKGFGQGVKRTF